MEDADGLLALGKKKTRSFNLFVWNTITREHLAGAVHVYEFFEADQSKQD